MNSVQKDYGVWRHIDFIVNILGGCKRIMNGHIDWAQKMRQAQENDGKKTWEKTWPGWVSAHGRPGHMIGLSGCGSIGRPKSIQDCSVSVSYTHLITNVQIVEK